MLSAPVQLTSGTINSAALRTALPFYLDTFYIYLNNMSNEKDNKNRKTVIERVKNQNVQQKLPT